MNTIYTVIRRKYQTENCDTKHARRLWGEALAYVCVVGRGFGGGVLWGEALGVCVCVCVCVCVLGAMRGRFMTANLILMAVCVCGGGGVCWEL